MDPKHETKRKSFDQAAELYDRYRPGYPDELVDYILSASAIPPEGRILEIGSGPGKATLAFARRGYAMLCIEPGQNLAALAAQKLAAFPSVSFVITRFEDWPEQPGEFDLVISASAFHWVTPEIGYPKASRALKPGASLALFWNMQADFDAEVERIHEQTASSLGKADREPIEARILERMHAIEASGSFSEVAVKRFPWTCTYDTQAYLGWLNTHSSHLVLPEATRQKLNAELGGVIDSRGGYIEMHFVAVVYMAKKSDS